MQNKRSSAPPMHLRSSALVGFCALVLAACQHVERAPIDPAANAARLDERSLDDPTVQAALERHAEAAAPGTDWSLDQLTLAAWALRTDVAVARAEVDAARAATGLAARRPDPVLRSPNEKVISDTLGSPWVLAAEVAFTLELGGKREIRRQRALAEQAVLGWRLGEILWSARAEVRAGLLEHTFARLRLALDEDEVMLRRAYLAWVETRFARGAATAQERLLALEALGTIESRRELDGAALAKSSATLAAAIGVSSRALGRVEPRLPPVDDLPSVVPSDLNAARDLAISNRLDIRRALAEYEIAEQDLRAAVASQYPDLSLVPGYLVDQGDHKIALGFELPLPLRNSSDARIARAVAARTVAAARFDQVQSTALAEIDIGFVQYQATLRALAAAIEAEQETEGALAAAQRRLTAGAADRGELLGTQVALITRSRNTLDARRAVLEAVTALEHGVERPLYPPSSLDTAAELEELLVGPGP